MTSKSSWPTVQAALNCSSGSEVLRRRLYLTLHLFRSISFSSVAKTCISPVHKKQRNNQETVKWIKKRKDVRLCSSSQEDEKCSSFKYLHLHVQQLLLVHRQSRTVRNRRPVEKWGQQHSWMFDLLNDESSWVSGNTHTNTDTLGIENNKHMFILMTDKKTTLMRADDDSCCRVSRCLCREQILFTR